MVNISFEIQEDVKSIFDSLKEKTHKCMILKIVDEKIYLHDTIDYKNSLVEIRDYLDDKGDPYYILINCEKWIFITGTNKYF